MALRKPLLTQDKEAIKEWTDADRDQVHKRIAYCYANDPSVYLEFVASGGNISPEMDDTRYRSGAASTDTGGNFPASQSYPPESTTQEPTIVTTTWDKVSMVRNAPGHNWGFTSYPGIYETGNGPKPVYYEGRTTGNPGTDGGYSIREMSFQDLLDTFIDPVITHMENETTDPLGGGTHFVSTSATEPGCTTLGKIFEDTKAGDYSSAAGSIGTAGTFQDIQGASTSYYLHKNDGVEETYRLPLVIDYTSNGVNSPAGLREMTQTEFQALFCPLIRTQVWGGVDNAVFYNFDGDGVTKGTAINNTVQTGVTGNYQTRLASANDYRAQEFPNGTLTTAETWRLKLNRT